MMTNVIGIEEMVVETPSWSKQKLIACVKSVNGKMFIDLRKWVKNEGTEILRPRLGIMLSVDDWPKAMEAISKLVEGYK